jgi:hypothetical protein
VEIWFSILSRQGINGASFASPYQIRQAIDKFVAARNQNAAPFEWTKRTVSPVNPKHRYADLCN